MAMWKDWEERILRKTEILDLVENSEDVSGEVRNFIGRGGEG